MNILFFSYLLYLEWCIVQWYIKLYLKMYWYTSSNAEKRTFIDDDVLYWGGYCDKKNVPKLGILTLLRANFAVVDVFMTIANQETILLPMKCDKIRAFCIFFDLLIWRNLRPTCTQSKMSLHLPNVIVHKKSFFKWVLKNSNLFTKIRPINKVFVCLFLFCWRRIINYCTFCVLFCWICQQKKFVTYFWIKNSFFHTPWERNSKTQNCVWSFFRAQNENVAWLIFLDDRKNT